MTSDIRERLEELLACRATEGLTPEEASELRFLLAQHPELSEDTFDLAAAELDLAFGGVDVPLPDGLHERILRRGETMVLAENSEVEGAASPPGHPERELTGEERILDASARFEARGARGGAWAWGGWLAAAAAVVVAVLGWWQAAGRGEGSEPLRSRTELLETAADVRVTPWNGTEDPSGRGAEGDVLWSASAQEGYMRIRGLAPNDPTREQYQLWVFDRERDERYPVDGGVFDIPAGAGEVIVPIRAAVAVDAPVLYAVTVERPGGVVVSSRERIVLLGKVEG